MDVKHCQIFAGVFSDNSIVSSAPIRIMAVLTTPNKEGIVSCNKDSRNHERGFYYGSLLRQKQYE